MSAVETLRLAWQSHRDGKLGRRDALLTLAAAEAAREGADQAPWTGAVRAFLVASHPGHLFSGFASLERALDDGRVLGALGRLRATFPPGRVRWLLRRAEVARGPFDGRKAGLRMMLDDLLSPASPRLRPRRRHQLGTAAHLAPREAASLPPGFGDVPVSASTGQSLAGFYLNVLLAIAVLCAIVLQESGSGNRAA